MAGSPAGGLAAGIERIFQDEAERGIGVFGDADAGGGEDAFWRYSWMAKDVHGAIRVGKVESVMVFRNAEGPAEFAGAVGEGVRGRG